MKKLINGLSSFLLCTVYLSPGYAMENPGLDPDVIFTQRNGGRVTLPQHTTKAASLHNENIKGQCQDGKRLIAAVIDLNIHPNFTRSIDRSLIHPASFSEGLIYDPEEEVDQSPIGWIHDEMDKLKSQPPLDEDGRIQRKQELKRLRKLNKDRAYFEYALKKNSGTTHGSGVAQTLRLIAPEAQLLLIDLEKSKGLAHNVKLAAAIRKAVENGADVINVSLKIGEDALEELKEACQTAVAQGIAIITSAGNASHQYVPLSSVLPSPGKNWSLSPQDPIRKSVPYFLDESSTVIKDFVKDNQIDIFNHLKGKGMLFACAVKCTKSGKEKMTPYTQLPTVETQKHALCAAGGPVPANFWNNPNLQDINRVDRGTSIAAPEIAGGYVLLKQWAIDNNYPLSTDELLNIMYESGRDVHYSAANSMRTDRIVQDNVYKSLDLVNAKKMLEERFAPARATVMPQRALRPLPPLPTSSGVTLSQPVGAADKTPPSAVCAPRPLPPLPTSTEAAGAPSKKWGVVSTPHLVR